MRHSRPLLVATAGLVAALLVGWYAVSPRAGAATITASYAAGYRDVIVNDYGAQGLGVFHLADGATTHRALCIEADRSHTQVTDAYAPASVERPSAQLDTLIWLVSWYEPIDDDTAIAAAALAWYYADAKRTIGPPVWSNGAAGFARIAPDSPESWDSLARFTAAHPVGLLSGGRHLDVAEARVAGLHREVTRLLGPWTLAADEASGRFRLSGANGPIAGHAVDVSVRVPGRPVATTRQVTDEHGWVTPPRASLAEGATVDATAVAPGSHLEWDGAGPVQRMITATSTTLSATLHVPASPRHIELLKTSSDLTIGVAGATFELIDARGRQVARGATDRAGKLRFGPIDPVANPAPYIVRELSAPPGLGVAADVAIPVASRDADEPTVVRITDAALTAPVTVRKALTQAVGPSDRSGFSFSLVRRADGARVEVTTGPDGTTAPVPLALGTYDVCETATPEWASGTTDAGCVTIEVTPADVSGTSTIEVDYLNEVAPPTIATEATDAADGDHHVPAGGGVVVDRVRLDQLVAGTTYTIRGSIWTRGGDPTEVVGTTSFEATGPAGVVEISFDTAALPPGPYVVVEELYVGDALVAEHRDLADAAQTVEVDPPPTSTTTSTTSPTTTVAGTTTIPAPTIPATSTTTTSSTIAGSTPTTSEPTVAALPPRPVPPVPTVPTPRLARTGGGAPRGLLRTADLAFVAGVALIVISTRTRRSGTP